jgi:hypothetical protein
VAPQNTQRISHSSKADIIEIFHRLILPYKRFTPSKTCFEEKSAKSSRPNPNPADIDIQTASEG